MITFVLLIFILGTLFGSFLNVCIYRLPRGESVVFPPSKCPICGKPIEPADLIPILGFFVLGRKCRHCKKPISWRYPLVEALSGLFFVLIWIHSGGRLFYFVFEAIFVLLLLLVFFTDLELQLIPDSAWMIGIAAGLLYNFLQSGNLGFSAVMGMMLGFLLLYLIGKIGALVFKKEAMGCGDPLFAAFLGAYLGWQGAFLSIFIAYLLAGMAVFFLLTAGKAKLGSYIPFGPALSAGAIITLFFERQIIGWYFGMFL